MWNSATLPHRKITTEQAPAISCASSGVGLIPGERDKVVPDLVERAGERRHVPVLGDEGFGDLQAREKFGNQVIIVLVSGRKHFPQAQTLGQSAPHQLGEQETDPQRRKGWRRGDEPGCGDICGDEHGLARQLPSVIDCAVKAICLGGERREKVGGAPLAQKRPVRLCDGRVEPNARVAQEIQPKTVGIIDVALAI